MTEELKIDYTELQETVERLLPDNFPVSFEELAEDYFRHAFGDKWQEVRSYLEKLSACFDYEYMSGHKSADPTISKIYDPAQAVKLAEVSKIVAAFAPVIAANKVQRKRACTIAWRLLEQFGDFVNYTADLVMKRAVGDNESANEIQKRFLEDFSAREIYMQTCYDQFEMVHAYKATDLIKL